MLSVHPSPPPQLWSYVIGLVVIGILGVVAIVTLELVHPERDNTNIHVMIIGFIGTIGASVMAVMKSQETHLSVNSRLDDFVKNARSAAHADGMIEGQDLQRVSRTQGPIEDDATTPKSAGFKVTSIYRRHN